MSNPKEKAEQLVDRMSMPENIYQGHELAKQCAIIAVDEIIKEYGTYYKVIVDDKQVSYWQQVKKEIENL